MSDKLFIHLLCPPLNQNTWPLHMTKLSKPSLPLPNPLSRMKKTTHRLNQQFSATLFLSEHDPAVGSFFFIF